MELNLHKHRAIVAKATHVRQKGSLNVIIDLRSNLFGERKVTEYLLLIHGNAKTKPTAQEWNQFFNAAQQSGFFAGGSAVGQRTVIGDTQMVKSSDHIVGYMRFDAESKQKLLDLLKQHPVVMHGGSVELCEMSQS